MTRILPLLIFLVSGLNSAPASTTDHFEAANRAFAAGGFEAAASGYEAVIRQNGPSASALYNLGNARQKLGQHGPAILAYERARLITPRDPDLLANLNRARKTAAAFEEPSLDPRLHAVLQKLSRNEWSWLAASSALALGTLSLLLGSVPLPKPRVRPFSIATACLALFLLAASATALYLRRGEVLRGVVLAKDAPVRLSPFDKAEAVGTPAAGRIVELGKHNGGYQYIKVPGSRLEGWIASDRVAAVETP